MPELLQFTIRRTDNGVWIKEREDGRRGLCVADEAVLWQALKAAEGRAGARPGAADVGALIAENERLHRENEGLLASCERLAAENHQLALDNVELRANQRRRPGRPRRSDVVAQAPQGLSEAPAAPERDPLDEDL